ncbi:MAG: hypothetical protein K0R73_1414, partial [Candidatus Midichloriaceae bacterium]|nr:hypothetical protein [Candidatus Midichloriaceae bacterium]
EVNSIDQSGTTALIYAAKSGNLEVVKFLLENGADANTKNKDGKSALMMIVDSGNLDLLQTLIDKKLGVEALEYAITSGNFWMAKACVNKQIKVETKVGRVYPILAAAITSGDLDIMNMIFSKVSDQNLLTTFKNEALHYAIKQGDLEMVKSLIDQGANINYALSSIPPISSAILLGHMEIADLLLAQEKLNVNILPRDENNPLRIAIKYNKVDVLRKMLFEKGGDLYSQDIVTYNQNKEYYINDGIVENEASKQVITEYLSLERDFREKFADKAKEKIANHTGVNSLESAYKEINIALKDLVQDDDKKFTSAFRTKEIKIKLNFVDKFIIEIKALLGLSDKLDTAKERICMRIEEEIYKAIKNSELFKKLTPELEGNISVTKALTGIEEKLSKAEKVAAERANKANQEIRGK